MCIKSDDQSGDPLRANKTIRRQRSGSNLDQVTLSAPVFICGMHMLELIHNTWSGTDILLKGAINGNLGLVLKTAERQTGSKP